MSGRNAGLWTCISFCRNFPGAPLPQKRIQVLPRGMTDDQRDMLTRVRSSCVQTKPAMTSSTARTSARGEKVLSPPKRCSSASRASAGLLRLTTTCMTANGAALRPNTCILQVNEDQRNLSRLSSDKSYFKKIIPMYSEWILDFFDVEYDDAFGFVDPPTCRTAAGAIGTPSCDLFGCGRDTVCAGRL